MEPTELRCAGRPVPNARDQIRRYCGLPWSGGEAETWAYEYFDAVPTGPGDFAGPPDLLAAAALHPGFGRPEMTFFNGGGAEACERWLAELPGDVDLADADDQTVDHLVRLPEIFEGGWLSIVSKVTHHKRPRLVPLFDRAIVDWYRPVTRVRGEASWPQLVVGIKADLGLGTNRRFLADLKVELDENLEGPTPSGLRLLDIGVWMSGREH